MATLKILKEAILESVSILDEADGSRSASNEAIDAVRDILADAYGSEFDGDLEEYEGSAESDGDSDDQDHDDN